MKTVRVNLYELKDILKDNRLKHVTEYEEAMKEFRKEAIKKMAYNLETAQGGGEIEVALGLVRPQSFQEHYDTAIRMLEMSTEKEVELTVEEFRQYVEDKWQWKHQFISSTSMYNNKA